MAQQEDTISHFAHPEHQLVKRHYTGPFFCDICWEDLTGPAYGCPNAGCDFAIHEACAGHPQTLTSPAHHTHPLELVPTSRDASLVCDVCMGRCAPACFLYRCTPCDFDMHPRCTQLPQVVCSAWHSEHDLTLVDADGCCAAAACAAAAGRAWYYRCTTCNVDLHVSCAAAAVGDNNGANAIVEQIHQASAAQTKILHAQMLARIRVQGVRSLVDLASPSCKSPLASVVQNFD